MALESTQVANLPANRVIAIAGRFAQAARVAPPELSLHILHGDQDAVIPASHGSDSADRWRQLGDQVSLDIFPGLGHGIDQRVANRISALLGAS